MNYSDSEWKNLYRASALIQGVQASYAKRMDKTDTTAKEQARKLSEINHTLSAIVIDDAIEAAK